MDFKLVAFVCVTVLGFIEAGKIPEYIHICKRNDPHIAKCIRESIEVLRPKLKVGLPELKVPGLEPLHIKEIVIFRGDEGRSNFKATLRNLEVTGASNFELTKLKVSTDRNTFRVGIKLPVLDVHGDYDIDAKVLVVPIKGTDKFTAKISDVEGQGVLKAEVEPRDGKKYLKFTSFDIVLKIGDYDLHLENLFNGDPVLGQAANEVLNENKGDFIPAAIPFIQRKVSEMVLQFANRISQDVDYDELFPEK